MKLSGDKLRDFVADIPFYENNECFCLGNDLSAAGTIVGQIVNNCYQSDADERGKANVGMVDD